jgi:hypothetical protein
VSAAVAAHAEKPQTVAAGVQVDFAQGRLIAVASCAADLYPPSADVARLKAERVARSRAEDKLRKALPLLVRQHKAELSRFGGADQVAKLDPKTATVQRIDYGATGSVVLWLALPLAASKERVTSDSATAGAPDAGASPSEEH